MPCPEMPPSFPSVAPERVGIMDPMRLPIVVLILAVVLLTSGCAEPVAPVAKCTPGDTVRTRFPLVSADKRDTVWASSFYVCPLPK